MSLTPGHNQPQRKKGRKKQLYFPLINYYLIKKLMSHELGKKEGGREPVCGSVEVHTKPLNHLSRGGSLPQIDKKTKTILFSGAALEHILFLSSC